MNTPKTNALLENLPLKHATRMLRMTRHARDLEIELQELKAELDEYRRKHEPHQQPCPCAWCRVEEDNKAANPLA